MSADLIERLFAWGQNSPDPDYFQGDILSSVLSDCALAADAALEHALAPFAEIADVENEVGREDPEDDRIWIVQAHGCQLGELSVDDFRLAARSLSQDGEEGA